MNQREYIFQLTKNGKKPNEIEQLLQQRFGQEAFGRTTVYKWSAQAKIGINIENDKESHYKPGRKPDVQLLIRIQQILEEMPFSSTRSIADILNVNNNIIYRYLTAYLGKVYKASRWVPHFLNLQQKQNRVDETKKLSYILKKCQHESFRNILTGDQKWFTLYYGNDGAWLNPDQESPEMEDDQISHKKVMVTIVWGVFGFYVVDFLPDGQSYNSDYFIKNILQPLSQIRQDIWTQSDQKKIWLHLDNSRIHNSKTVTSKYGILGFKRTPHPAYSPDVAPSDFYLFGLLEEKLKGHKFNDVDELKEALYEILDAITFEERKSVFLHWIERCNWVSLSEGNYFHK